MLSHLIASFGPDFLLLQGLILVTQIGFGRFGRGWPLLMTLGWLWITLAQDLTRLEGTAQMSMIVAGYLLGQLARRLAPPAIQLEHGSLLP